MEYDLMSLVFNGAGLNVFRVPGRIAIILERQKGRKGRGNERTQGKTRELTPTSSGWESGNRYDIPSAFISPEYSLARLFTRGPMKIYLQ